MKNNTNALKIVQELEKHYTKCNQDENYCDLLQMKLDDIRSKCEHNFDHIGQETGSGKNLVECSKCLIVDYYQYQIT